MENHIQEHYDIYIYHHHIRLTPNCAQVKEDLRKWLGEHINLEGGFIGLNMTIEEIMDVQKIRGRGVQKLGVVIPAKYRIAKITLEQATEIAKTYFANMILPKYPAQKYELEELKYDGVAPMTYHFFVLSQKLIREGYVPDTFFINVDTLDGHCWDMEEQSAYWSYIESQEREHGVYPWDRFANPTDL